MNFSFYFYSIFHFPSFQNVFPYWYGCCFPVYIRQVKGLHTLFHRADKWNAEYFLFSSRKMGNPNNYKVTRYTNAIIFTICNLNFMNLVVSMVAEVIWNFPGRNQTGNSSHELSNSMQIAQFYGNWIQTVPIFFEIIKVLYKAAKFTLIDIPSKNQSFWLPFASIKPSNISRYRRLRGNWFHWNFHKLQLIRIFQFLINQFSPNIYFSKIAI